MQRVLPQLLLPELWDDAGPLAATPVRDLTAFDIRTLLQAGSVWFVVANIASPLRWVSVGECFRFWKAEVQSRVADPGGARLEDFPGEYCYFASEWAEEDGPPVVLPAVAH